MNASHHATSHLGKANCDRFQVAQPIRRTVTIGDVNLLAHLYAAKLQIAIYHNCEVAIRAYEENLKVISLYADDLKAVGG